MTTVHVINVYCGYYYEAEPLLLSTAIIIIVDSDSRLDAIARLATIKTRVIPTILALRFFLVRSKTSIDLAMIAVCSNREPLLMTVRPAN